MLFYIATGGIPLFQVRMNLISSLLFAGNPNPFGKLLAIEVKGRGEMGEEERKEGGKPQLQDVSIGMAVSQRKIPE